MGSNPFHRPGKDSRVCESRKQKGKANLFVSFPKTAIKIRTHAKIEFASERRFSDAFSRMPNSVISAIPTQKGSFPKGSFLTVIETGALRKRCSVSQSPTVGKSQQLSLAELRRATGSFEAVLAYSLAPVFLDFMGFLASALKCCPSS